jgi:general secretion pathway protein G
MLSFSRACRRRARRRGFTLVEVLLVLMILVFLASMAVMAYGPIQRQWKTNAAKGQIGLFGTALDMYQLAVGSYPTTGQGLEALRHAPGDLPNPTKWDGPYLKSEIPLDPWDRPYQYACPGQHHPDSYDVWTVSPEGAEIMNQ